MDEILKDLHDPRWWFTAILIAILVSILAGFLKDATSRWIARYSDWYRKRRAATLARREFQLEMLVSNPNLLSAHNSFTITRLLMFVMMSAVFLYMPIFIELSFSGQSPYFAKSRPADFTLMNSALRTFFMLVGIVCTCLGYSAMSSLAVTSRAYRELIRRHLAVLREEEEQRGQVMAHDRPE